ncbi:M14 family zinc carboxypeptidase [Phytoactinopolyspora mesophila]|uniref:Peptidase M14 domain-containing protein n=1 Tax=Phytoactinopolyspora mesophila TaxID=2650750 RepID=A0A7K3M854_9ACTN|nr:M14 family zinc carboxypeptidase [Phytoactinopolyspora mesophila]NDL59370.1 hypothetical protein [Phytoactinopolyspora mesophila]
MSVPLSRIQPPADQLLGHKEVVDAMERLAERPHVRVEELGRSREGRSIDALVIGRPDVVADPRAVQEQARRWSLPRADVGSDAGWDPDCPVPVLFLASNYGNEAAQTEALLEVAARLAEPTPGNEQLLRRLVVLVVPLLNPDGRERALATWRHHPLATGLTAYGNHYDIQVAREYLHVIEPESAALADVVSRWHPMLVWELHEDSINLGRTFAENCLCPPMSPSDAIGSWVASSPGDNDPRLWQQEVKYGAAIAEAWRTRGYRLLHDPDGRHGWPGPADTGLEEVAKHPETRFTRAMALRGVTTFITESARRPGTQTWEERVGQKVAAGLAVAETAAGDVAALTSLVREVGMSGANGPAGYFVIPSGQDRHVVDRAVWTLGLHDVEILQEDDGSFVIPKAQARGTTAEILLSLVRGRHQSLVATLGLRVVESAAGPAPDRRALPPWSGLDAPWLNEPDTDKPDSPSDGAGRSPRVALYAGQGVKDFAAEGHLGSVRRLLEHEGIPFVLIEAGDVAEGCLDGVDVLVIPKGDATAILNGSQPGPLWYGPPWQPEEEPRGLGVAGVAAIRAFVDRGGHYVGIDGGGAALATARHLGLIDCGISAENLGTGLVELATTVPGDRLFAGLPGSWDEAGRWRDGLIYAMTDCEAWLQEFGAIVLDAGTDVEVLATYSQLLPVPGVSHFGGTLPDGSSRRRAAIVRGRHGRGTVTLFAVNPTYRSLSPYSARLLANAVRSQSPIPDDHEH